MPEPETAAQIMDALDHLRALINADPPPSAAEKQKLQQQFHILSDALDSLALGLIGEAADHVATASQGLSQVSGSGMAQSSAQAALVSMAGQKKATTGATAATPLVQGAASPAGGAPAGKMNEAGFALLRQWEGCVLHAYDDADPAHPPVKPGAPVRGKLTIGYGRTGNDVTPGLTCTQEQANVWLQADIGKFVAAIAPLIKIPLNDNQFSAFVCFAYNVGVTAFKNGSPLACANAGDLAGVPGRLSLYNRTKIDGVFVASTGLTRRRAAEIALWLTPP